jgi:putative ABC transport system permease protein
MVAFSGRNHARAEACLMGRLRRFVNVFRSGRLDRDFNDELEFHRQMRVRKAREQGLNEEEAEREAGRRMGNRPLAKEEMRDARMLGWLSSSLQDLRHGVTLLRRDAGTSALMILVLALGIGGNAAIFTLLKAAFLDPLPYRDAVRLVTILENSGWVPSVSEFSEIRARSRTLEQIAFAEYADMQLTGAGEPARVYAARVSASFFPLLGVNPPLGRTFLEEENQPGWTPVVMLTDSFWRSQMGADPNVAGRSLRLNGKPARVTGVLPPGFHFDYPTLRIAEPVDIYVSYPVDPSAPFQSSGSGLGVAVRVIGRLKEGVTPAQAAADLRDIARALTREHPAAFPNPQHDPTLFSFDLFPLRDAIVGSQRSLLWLLLGGAGIVLLLACANTAQLLLARSLQRGREVAIRSALGASRLRLIRQFLLEGSVLAACGGAAGLLAAGWIVRVLVALLPVRSPLLASAHLGTRAVGFTLAISLISAVIFSIIPALKGSRWTEGPSLSVRATLAEGNRWRHGMIALEAALSVFLMCGAGLVALNLWTLISAPMGFDPKNVLAMRLQLPEGQQNAPAARARAVFPEYLRKVAAIPGVDSAATVTGPPLRPARGGPFQISGVPGSVLAYTSQVSPDYFRTLAIPLLAGRVFRESDAGDRITVAILNEEAARRFGLGRDVIGRAIDDPDGPIQIVGMVGNVRTRGLQTAPFPEVYLSSLQFSWTNVYVVVHSALPTGQLVTRVKTAIESADTDQAVFGVETMENWIAGSVTEPRFDVFLIGTFALLAVAMAAAGMYSVISCLVTQRTSEIAIRMALGSSRGAIVRTVLGTTVVWVAAGLACGLGLGFAARQTVRSLSGSIAEASPWIYVSVAILFLVVTLAAAYLPVRRASRLDPAVALRCE